MNDTETDVNGLLRVTLAGLIMDATIEQNAVTHFDEVQTDASSASPDLHIVFSDKAAQSMSDGSFDLMEAAKSGELKAEGDRKLITAFGQVMQHIGAFLEEKAYSYDNVAQDV